MRWLSVLVVVAMPLAARGDDTCVRVRKGAVVRSRPGGDAVGRTTAAVAGRVVERGDLVRVEIETLRGAKGRRTTDGKVTVAVARRDVEPGRCPPGADMGELALLSDFLDLRFRDGEKAGWTHPFSVIDAASPSRDRVTLDGEAWLCFDDPVVAGLVVHVCGSCAKLRERAGLGLTRLPCDE